MKRGSLGHKKNVLKEDEKKEKASTTTSSPFVEDDPVPKRIRTRKAFIDKLLEDNKDIQSYASHSYFSLLSRLDSKAIKKYCDITGLPAKYSCPKTGIRYCSSTLYPLIKSLSVDQVQHLLKLRNANTILK